MMPLVGCGGIAGVWGSLGRGFNAVQAPASGVEKYSQLQPWAELSRDGSHHGSWIYSDDTRRCPRSLY